jgi:hypothetical protein
MKTSLEREAEISNGTTAGSLKSWLDKVPENAVITIRHEDGDRPFDPSYDYIKARWTENG